MRKSKRNAGTMRMGLVVCGLVLCVPAKAQQQTDGPAIELKPNLLTALRAFEAPANEDYTLGRGDEIAIDFAGHPDMTVKKIVGPDGRITLPPGGSIEVSDKTREQAAEVIAASLSPYYTRLSVTVGVDKYTSNHVLLLGAVERPGVVTFDAPPTLLEVLTIGGGIAKNTEMSTIMGPTGATQPVKMASAVPERVAIYRGQEQVLWVDVKGLVDSGSALADLRLRRGDVVYVPSAAERYVSVLGQVNHPGALQLDRNTTLAKLLAEAGGLTALAGKNPAIEVVSTATGKSRAIPFKALLQPGTLDLTLNSGDVVYVTESGFNQASYVLEKLSPLISLFTTAALFSRQ